MLKELYTPLEDFRYYREERDGPIVLNITLFFFLMHRHNVRKLPINRKYTI